MTTYRLSNSLQMSFANSIVSKRHSKCTYFFLIFHFIYLWLHFCRWFFPCFCYSYALHLNLYKYHSLNSKEKEFQCKAIGKRMLKRAANCCHVYKHNIFLDKWLLFNCTFTSDFNFYFIKEEEKRNRKQIKLNQMRNGNEEKNVNAYKFNLLKTIHKAIIPHRIWFMEWNVFTWVLWLLLQLGFCDGTREKKIIGKQSSFAAFSSQC